MTRLCALATVCLLPLICASNVAAAECGVESGSVRVLSNDIDSLGVVLNEARLCASDTVNFRANRTTEHKSIQVSALTIDPAIYSVAMVSTNTLPPLLSAGLVRPLDEYVEKYGQNLEPDQLIKINGKTVAIAFMANSQHLFMRGDILSDLGISPPRTYQEVLDAARAIRDAGIMQYPLAASYEAGWYLGNEFVNNYLSLDGQFFEPGSAEPTINNSKGVQVLELMKDMTEYMPPEYLTQTADDLKKLYLDGKVAIINQWGSMVNSHIDPNGAAPEISEATLLAPAPTLGGYDIPAAALWWDGFTIAKNVSDEDAEASFRAMMYGMSLSVANENPNAATWLIKGYEAPESARGVLDTISSGGRPYPMNPFMGLMHAALGSELTDFMQGRESAESALANVEAAYRTSARASGFLY